MRKLIMWLAVLAIYAVIVWAIAANNADPGAAAGITVGVTVAFIAIVLLYFMPTLVARRRGVHNHQQVFVVNLLTGWSLIGWVIALVMAYAPVQGQDPVRS